MGYMDKQPSRMQGQFSFPRSGGHGSSFRWGSNFFSLLLLLF